MKAKVTKLFLGPVLFSLATLAHRGAIAAMLMPLAHAEGQLKRPLVVWLGALPAVARMFLALLLASLSMGSSIEASHAEGYPERTIKLVVPFPAGGPADDSWHIHALCWRVL